MAEACVTGHSAYISDRGGNRRLGEIKQLSTLKWDRRVDDTSEAEINLGSASCSFQAEFLESIEPHRSELVIHRGKERVWEGPIDRKRSLPDGSMMIAAKDLSYYLQGRPLTRLWDNSIDSTLGPEPTTTRLERILQHELLQPYFYESSPGVSTEVKAWEAMNPPINFLEYLVVHHFPNEVTTRAKTLPFEMMLDEHLGNFASSGGIDYVVVGRAMHIWDTNRPLAKGVRLTDADFLGEIEVQAIGSEHATIGLAASTEGGVGGFATSEELTEYYGPWAKLFAVYSEDATDDGASEPSTAELRSQAKRNMAGRNPVPVFVSVPSGSSVRLSDKLQISDLVPGTHFELLANVNGRPLSQTQKLKTMSVEETATGEDVKITLIPAPEEDAA